MHRIDTKTAQKDKFGAGKNGFTRGNPQTGTPATDLDDDYFDMLQEELCGVVEASGASLEKGRHDQLLTALRALLLSRKNPFGDIKSDGTVKTALQNLGLGDTSGYVGRRLSTRVFTSSGTYTPTPGTKRIRVTITGGGGGGCGCKAASSNETFFGAGGGAGGTTISTMTLTENSYPVVIGAGGGGGVGASVGYKGGDSSFSSLIAPGGEGAGKPGITTQTVVTEAYRILAISASLVEMEATVSQGISASAVKAVHRTGEAVDAQALAVVLAVRHMVQVAVVHTMPVIAELI